MKAFAPAEFIIKISYQIPQQLQICNYYTTGEETHTYLSMSNLFAKWLANLFFR